MKVNIEPVVPEVVPPVNFDQTHQQLKQQTKDTEELLKKIEEFSEIRKQKQAQFKKVMSKMSSENPVSVAYPFSNLSPTSPKESNLDDSSVVTIGNKDQEVKEAV